VSEDLAQSLDRIRAGIDAVDDGLVELLARRRKLVLGLAKIKKALDIPIYDAKREKALLVRVSKWGDRHGLDKKFVADVFRRVIANSKRVQRREHL
jgi:chorismate mutase